MKLSHTTLTRAVLAALACMANTAYADHEYEYQEEVVVTGSRTATNLSDTPQAIGVVRKYALQRDKPKTMGDIINRIPGVHWNDLGNEQHSMGIRQPIGTNSVYQYLEDGIPIRPLGVFNHNSLNEMNMAGAQSVEVVKGPASSLYGSNAVGGAINFMTAPASRTPYARVGVQHDNIAGFTRYDTAASDTWGALGLRFSHYSSRRTDNNWQEYSRGNKDSFSLRGDYALGASSLLRATFVHTDLDAAMTGSLGKDDYDRNPGKSINTFTYRKDRTTRLNLAWEGQTIERGTSTVTVFGRKNDHGQLPAYTVNKCTKNTSTCPTGTRGTINNNHVDSLGLDVKHQQDFDWLASRLVTGVYVDKSDNPFVSDNLSIVQDPTSKKNLSYAISNAVDAKGVRDYEAGIKNVAFFAQWEFSPIKGMRTVVGGRSDAIDYDFRNNLAPGGSDNFGAPNESRSFSHFSPKIGTTYLLGKTASVYANLSEGFTPPEVSQLYGKTGIPNLKPATYDNVEIGLRMAFLDGALKLDSALYRLDGRDTIVSYGTAVGISENRNAGRTRSQGLELGLTHDSHLFDMRFGTTLASHRYLKYQVSSTVDYSGKKMPQAPSDITTAEIGYKPKDGARLALELVHQGKYWMDNANSVKYPGHTLLNLRGSYRIAKGWDGWLHARNLADRKYADSASSSNGAANSQYSPGAPRSFMLGLSYTFEEKSN